MGPALEAAARAWRLGIPGRGDLRSAPGRQLPGVPQGPRRQLVQRRVPSPDWVKASLGSPSALLSSFFVEGSSTIGYRKKGALIAVWPKSIQLRE